MTSGHVVLGGPLMYFCMLVMLSCKSSLVDVHINYSMYMFTSNKTSFSSLDLVGKPASVHSLPQLLVVPAYKPIWVLFALSLHLAFFLLPISTHKILFVL